MPSILIVSFYFPPAGGGGVQRPLKFAKYLTEFGFDVSVLAPTDPRWIHRDPSLHAPDGVTVYRAPYWGPRGRVPAEELYGRTGLDRLVRRAQLLPRRLFVPDENVAWHLTALPAALRIVRRRSIDIVLTTSPPNSMHLLGAAVKRLAGVRWVADLRDAVVANPNKPVDRLAARLRERAQRPVARVVAARADAVVAVTSAIAAEIEAAGARGPLEVIANGADFDDFDGLDYVPADRFRITHTGSFFGRRDPRPFLRALVDADDAVVGRFVGDFRKADREWARDLEAAGRLELIPFAARERTLALQRDSEALLLLLPDVGERGLDVPSGKLFEYLGARRPIIAAVPRDGAAARLIEEAGAGIVVAPDDAEGLREAVAALAARWRDGALTDVELPHALEERLARRTRVAELAAFLRALP